MGESSSNPQGAGTGNVSSTSIPQGLGMGQAHSQQQSAVQCPAASNQPPLIANPPSEPLIIPSHVANALLLTR